MTRWDSDNLNEAHTQRELHQEFGCNLVDQLREVTGGKLDYTNTSNSLRLKAADRIAQLERELAAAKQAVQHANDHADAAIDELAAEKALTDMLYEDSLWGICSDAAYVSYRKARGL